jgi:cell fate regulator YaaT (PSP1 superfamily)
MNTFDWLSALDLHDPTDFQMVEVSFKNGARKDFYRKADHAPIDTGDMVVVETSSGLDVGRISLSGELVRLQMRKKRVDEKEIGHSVLRRAHERDMEKLEYARSRERECMVKARAIARTMDLNMKIGDVEFQGDGRKATFYYTAEGRIDFRELVRNYAREFKVKIEMRQIGSRQESARIGGIGSCGRELCCSTWLSDFKSVTTVAARYQNLAINQTKLSGQCGRLKCCLNYELDTYLDALKDFPKDVDSLDTNEGTAELMKTDIFKGIMFYILHGDRGRGTIVAVTKERVAEIKKMNLKGEFPEKLLGAMSSGWIPGETTPGEDMMEFADGTGEIELPQEKRKKKRNKGKRKPYRGNNRSGNQGQNKGGGRPPRDGNRDNRRTNNQNKNKDKK